MMSIWFFRMNHRLSFDEQRKKVIDANIKDLDRYEIFDPRNPLTKRRRELSKKAMEEASKRQRHMWRHTHLTLNAFVNEENRFCTNILFY